MEKHGFEFKKKSGDEGLISSRKQANALSKRKFLL